MGAFRKKEHTSPVWLRELSSTTTGRHLLLLYCYVGFGGYSKCRTISTRRKLEANMSAVIVGMVETAAVRS